MRKYRMCVPIILILLSILFVQRSNSNDLLLDISYNQLTKETQKQIDCLADNIYYEAGNEPRKGKEAVALVTLNRMQDPRFPKDICGVVKQKTTIAEKIVCQFSWFCQRVPRPNNYVYDEARDVAIFVYVNYENLKDITKGALYYHADYINPRWKLEKTTIIGRHIFYKESGKTNDDKNESPNDGRTIKTFFFSPDGRDIPEQR